MSWYIYTLLFYVFVSRSMQTAPITRRSFYIRRPDLDGRLVHNWTAVRASVSRVWECAGICSADSDCVSVSFKPMSEECVIYQRLVSTTDDFTLFPSVIVFALCPSGYSGLGRRCIKVVTEKMDWDSARAHCRDDNADLITLESQAKINEFRDFMATNGHESDNGYYWCAASKVSDGWQWINGKTLSNSALWCDGEPNFPNDEECASTRDPAFNCYYDDSCNENLKFVCEVQF